MGSSHSHDRAPEGTGLRDVDDLRKRGTIKAWRRTDIDGRTHFFFADEARADVEKKSNSFEVRDECLYVCVCVCVRLASRGIEREEGREEVQ